MSVPVYVKSRKKPPATDAPAKCRLPILLFFLCAFILTLSAILIPHLHHPDSISVPVGQSKPFFSSLLHGPPTEPLEPRNPPDQHSQPPQPNLSPQSQLHPNTNDTSPNQIESANLPAEHNFTHTASAGAFKSPSLNHSSTDKDPQLASDPHTNHSVTAHHSAASEPVPPPNSENPGLPQCPHAILFSAPRHGSTWLINSIERCKYTSYDSSGKRGYNRFVNLNSELWVLAQNGPVLNISAEDAAQYVQSNNSIKVFPLAVLQYQERVRRLLQEAKRMNLPIIFLTRDLGASFGSLKAAKAGKSWANGSQRHNKTDITSVSRVQDPETRKRKTKRPLRFDPYRSRVQRFFAVSRKLVEEVGITQVDELEYEKVKDKHIITAVKNDCYIRSCNY